MPASPYLNTLTSTGMVGVDLNVNHLAVANVNDIGQCVDAFTLPFNLEGKTSGQATKIIEAEVIALVDYAVKHHKPLAIERLDTTRSKVSRPYGHKKGNRRMRPLKKSDFPENENPINTHSQKRVNFS